MARITWPLTCAALSLASHATTGQQSDGSLGSNSSSGISSGSRTSAPDIVAEMRVMPPGPITLGVTPIFANSRLRVWVSPTIAALAVAKLVWPKLPSSPAPDVVLMMRPLTSSSPGLRSAAPVLGRGPAREPGAPYLHLHDEIEVGGRHVPDEPVAHDAGVVHQDVEPAVGVDGLLDHRVGLFLVAHVAVVRRRGAPASGDDVDDHVGVATTALAAHRRAEVVHDDCGPVLGELQGVPAAEAVAGAGDEGDLPFQEAWHAVRLAFCVSGLGA
jgi:hypothetical protein